VEATDEGVAVTADAKYIFDTYASGLSVGSFDKIEAGAREVAESLDGYKTQRARTVIEPGNATRYDIVVTDLGVEQILLSLPDWHSCMVVERKSFTVPAYAHEKLGCSPSTAVVVAVFLTRLGELLA
jgi:hypothetical protein